MNWEDRHAEKGDWQVIHLLCRRNERHSILDHFWAGEGGSKHQNRRIDGQTGAGYPGGVNFRGLENPLLNDRGEVAFPLTPGPNAEELTNGRTLPGTES